MEKNEIGENMNIFKSDLHIAPRLFCYVGIIWSFVNLYNGINFLELSNGIDSTKAFFLALFIVITISKIVAFYLVLRMKKNGLFLLVIIPVVLLFLLVATSEIMYFDIGPFLVPLILYGLLQIGGENSSWKRMV